MAINPTTGTLFVTLADTKYGSTVVYRSTPDIHRVDIDMADPRLIGFNPLTSSIVDFGVINIGSDIDTAIYITNRGKTDIVLRDVYMNKASNYASQYKTDFNGPVVIKPDEEYRLSITFSPRIEGTPIAIGISVFRYQATLEILFDVNSVQYSLNGAAYQPISVEEPAEIPTDYSLLQNYPNPFNPTTKIEYSLPVASKVRMSVYSSLGQEVATLIDEYQGMGKHIVDFSANNLPSGIYFYKLQTDKFNAVKKMMLVK